MFDGRSFEAGVFLSSDNDGSYLDNALYSSKAQAINSAASSLYMEGKPFSMENEVCGTDALNLLADYEHALVDLVTAYQTHTSVHLNNLFGIIQKSTNETDVESASHITSFT